MNMHLRLPDEMHNRLKAAAARDGNSVNTEVVTAIGEFLDRHQTEEVLERVEKTVERDASLLARLAE